MEIFKHFNDNQSIKKWLSDSYSLLLTIRTGKSIRDTVV